MAVQSLVGHRVMRPVAEVLPWFALMTLLLWVFIRRRTEITQPVHALAWFLSDFADFDWDMYVPPCVSLALLALRNQSLGVAVAGCGFCCAGTLCRCMVPFHSRTWLLGQLLFHHQTPSC